MVRKSLNTHGTLLVYLLCSLLTVGCFQKNRFGEIVNSGSQNNSKVQSTLIANNVIVLANNVLMVFEIETFDLNFIFIFMIYRQN